MNFKLELTLDEVVELNRQLEEQRKAVSYQPRVHAPQPLEWDPPQGVEEDLRTFIEMR